MKITVHGGSRVVVEDLGWFNQTFLSKFSVLTPHLIIQKQEDPGESVHPVLSGS